MNAKSKQYKTPHALEMAIKSAAKTSIQPTDRSISNFYHDRFLEIYSFF